MGQLIQKLLSSFGKLMFCRKMNHNGFTDEKSILQRELEKEKKYEREETTHWRISRDILRTLVTDEEKKI